MSAAPLKPCPHCGGEDPILEMAEPSGEIDNSRCSYRCRSCACEGPWGKSEPSARGWWNRRWTDDQAVRIVEVLASKAESAAKKRGAAFSDKARWLREAALAIREAKS